MISSLRNVDNVKHIALFNYDNSMCYHIAVLQRLHASPTLNEELSRLKLNEQTLDKNNICEILILPLKIYSELDDSNDSLIYSRIKEYFYWFVPNYVSNVAKHGYTPSYLLVYFMLPLIYKYFPTKFKTIIEELHINKIDFNNIEYVCEDVILNVKNSFLESNKHRRTILTIYKKMMNNLPDKIDRCNFVSAIMEIFPNRDKTGGHAVTLIKGRSNVEIENSISSYENFYVIDDQNAISKLSDYYNLRKEKLFEISIRDIDEVTMANINAIFHAKCDIDPTCKFSKRVTRFVLNFEHNFLSTSEDLLKPELEYVKLKYVDDIKNDKSTIPNEIGDSNHNLSALILTFISGIIAGLIIGLLSKNYMLDMKTMQTLNKHENNANVKQT